MNANLLKISSLLLILFVITISSCKNEEKVEVFTREGIPTKTLKGEMILNLEESSEDGTLATIQVYNDSIWIEEHIASPYSKNLLVFRNLNNPSMSKGYFQYGKGHMEMREMRTTFLKNKVACCSFESLTIFDIDSVFCTDYKPKTHRLNMPGFYFKVLKNDDLLVVNEEFFSYKSVKEKFNEEAVSIIRLNKKNNYSYPTIRYPYFVANIGQATIVVNEEKNRIIRFPIDVPEILVTDLSLNAIKTLIGPDKQNIEFQSYGNDISKCDYTKYFQSPCETDNYVYISYCGANKSFNAYTSPGEIIKMDWDGNIKEIYKFEKTLFHLTVLNEKTLYASAYVNKQLCLYKFEL